MSGMTGTTDYRGFHRIDFVAEAVFESLALKQQMIAEIEAVTSPDTILPRTPRHCLSVILPPGHHGLKR